MVYPHRGEKVFSWPRLTLARQFMLISFIVMLLGMLAVGFWVGNQIKTSVTNRTAAVTALYVDSFISPRFMEWAEDGDLSDIEPGFFEWLLADTALGEQVVSLKIWGLNGTVLYSFDPDLVGRKFPLDKGLILASAGEVHSELSELDEGENAYERQIAGELIETYAPIRAAENGTVIAISEFYQLPDGLLAEIWAAQLRSWLIVAAIFTLIYLLLAGIVQRGSNTIVAQQAALRDNLNKLDEMLKQNKDLHERVRRAAARTTALNEQYLRSISADLHDGPGQDLALALLRIESLGEASLKNNNSDHLPDDIVEDFSTVRTAVASALDELRTISAGLRLPAIESLSPTETVRRAIRDYEQKTQCQVKLTLGVIPNDIPLSVKITLYRIIREALANGYRHAEGKAQTVYVGVKNGTNELFLEVTDAGEGFDPQRQLANGHMGLSGMRERAEVLGGRFEIESSPGPGTKIRATLPLNIRELGNA